MTAIDSESGGTPLHSTYVFSYMRRGGGSGAGGKGAASSGAGKPSQEQAGDDITPGTTTATTTVTTTPTSTTATTTTAATTAAGKDSANAANPAHPYENAIRSITSVSTVESFWETYDYLKRPSELPTTTDYHFFREGIKPTWEDPGNARGGKWIVRLPKGLSSRYWEEVLLGLIGEQFVGVPAGEICGAVLSVRYSEDILGVWNASANDRDVIDRIRDSIKKILQLPPHANMEYKPHQASMQDRSSFRNTQVWKPKSLEGRSATTGTSTNATKARSNSWTEREERKPPNKGRDTGRAWR